MKAVHFEEELSTKAGLIDVLVEIGSATVETHDGSMVIVDGKVKGMTVTVTREDNVIHVRARQKKSWLGKLNSFLKRPRAHLTIKVPAHCEVHLKTITGIAAVRDVSAPVTVKVITGQANLENLGGRVEANVVTGKLNYNGLLVEDNHSFQTVTGSLRLHLAEEPNAQLDAKVITGQIRCNLPLTKESRSRPIPGARIKGILGSGVGQIKLRTITGIIHLDKIVAKEKKLVPDY